MGMPPGVAPLVAAIEAAGAGQRGDATWQDPVGRVVQRDARVDASARVAPRVGHWLAAAVERGRLGVHCSSPKQLREPKSRIWAPESGIWAPECGVFLAIKARNPLISPLFLFFSPTVGPMGGRGISWERQ